MPFIGISNIPSSSVQAALSASNRKLLWNKSQKVSVKCTQVVLQIAEERERSEALNSRASTQIRARIQFPFSFTFLAARSEAYSIRIRAWILCSWIHFSRITDEGSDVWPLGMDPSSDLSLLFPASILFLFRATFSSCSTYKLFSMKCIASSSTRESVSCSNYLQSITYLCINPLILHI